MASLRRGPLMIMDSRWPAADRPFPPGAPARPTPAVAFRHLRRPPPRLRHPSIIDTDAIEARDAAGRRLVGHSGNLASRRSGSFRTTLPDHRRARAGVTSHRPSIVVPTVFRSTDSLSRSTATPEPTQISPGIKGRGSCVTLGDPEHRLVKVVLTTAESGAPRARHPPGGGEGSKWRKRGGLVTRSKGFKPLPKGPASRSSKMRAQARLAHQFRPRLDEGRRHGAEEVTLLNP